MREKLVNGVFAAVVVPRRADGTLEIPTYQHVLEFLLRGGIRGFAVNGATGEYPLTTLDEFCALVSATADVCSGRARFVCGVGSTSLGQAVELGQRAMAGGAAGLLLPMPHFFPYQQDDLDAFCRAFASRMPVPTLLYNLPSFTTGLETETVWRLLAECPSLVGIKDSSGTLDILTALTRAGLDTCRVVGHDGVLAAALRERVCDGVISGIACALPELLLELWRQGAQTGMPAFAAAAARVDEFIQQTADLPVPWGLKWILESRGVAPASFAQAVSPRRAGQARALEQWFGRWRGAAGVS